MKPPFRVLPFDFFESPNEAAPAVEAIQISGAARHFELRARGGRVYFRLQDEKDERVWATLDDCDEADFIRTFRRAIGSGRFGRMFETRRRRGYSSTYLLLLMSARGEVQGREWCATRWFDLKPISPKLSAYLRDARVGVFHPKWSPPFREVLDAGIEDFWEQPLDEDDRLLTQRRWICGDGATLNKLVAPFVWANKTLLCHPVEGWFKFTFVPNQNRDDFFLPLETFPATAKDVLESYFQVQGVKWEKRHERPTRAAWEFYKSPHIFQVPAEPSAHERLEAHLFLREWLRDKLPPSQIEAILAHASS